MTNSASLPNIRLATDADLSDLYAIASASLPFDDFSEQLLSEKLFKNPNPDQFKYWVYLAELDGKPVAFMQGLERASQSKGWIGMFVVLEEYRRKGIATALFNQNMGDFRKANLTEIEALAIPGNYFIPGIDPRYTPALCFLEARGFEKFKDCANMTAYLDEPFDTESEAKRLAKLGITVRRATPDDREMLVEFFSKDFGDDWLMEASLALENDPPALHLAFKDNQVIAFSGHSSQNREWGFFGPMGTTPQARGTGIGRVLLWHCLNDLRNDGHKTSVIPWVGPIGFYSRYVPCRVDRVFWRYRTAVTDPSMPAT